MNTIASILQSHGWAIVGTFFTQYVWSAFIGALAAPTSTSSPGYVFFFKFANGIAGNLARAASTAVEHSPNFAPAVAKVINGQSSAGK
jgi:hypothetical protein